MSDTPRRKLHVLDPGLFFEGGHHASIARTLYAEAQTAGIDCELWGLRRIDHPPENLPITRHFARSAYARIDEADPFRDLLDCNADMFRDLTSANDRLANATLLFPTVTSRIATGIARWIETHGARVGADCALLLMFPPGFGGDETVRDAEFRIYRDAMSTLRSIPASRVRLHAETPEIARVFEELGAPPIRTLAWPVTVAASRPPRPRNAAPSVVHVGYSKVERGFCLLPDVIRRVHAAHPDASFTIQSNFWNAPRLEAATNEIASLPGVEVVRGPMPADRYASAMTASDIVLLPYDATAYARRGSGVFVEAASLGRILVLPANTWMADHAAESGLAAVPFDRFDADSVASALLAAIADRDRLLMTAQTAAIAWNEAKSPARFLCEILHGSTAGPIRLGGAA